MSNMEPLEYSVLDTALDGRLMKGDGGPKLGLDSKLTFSGNDDLVLGAAVRPKKLRLAEWPCRQ